jgi:CHAT domain
MTWGAVSCPTGDARQLFDLGLAHELYTTLFGPADALIKDKRYLLLVPTGALAALPFHLLITQTPTTPKPILKQIGVYRDAQWVIKRQAISVLPSVASLQALRVVAHAGQTTKPMIGFGDPVCDPAERATAEAARRGTDARVAVATRAYSEFWQGVVLDRNMLSKALPSLLDTADELKAVAAKLGAQQATFISGRTPAKPRSTACRLSTIALSTLPPTAWWRAMWKASASRRWL